MLDELLKFYEKREEELRKLSGLSKSNFQSNIVNIVSNVQQNYYNDNITGFEQLDDYIEAIKDNQEARESFLKNNKPLSKASQS